MPIELTNEEKSNLYYLITDHIEWLEDEDYDDPTMINIANDWRKLIKKMDLKPI